MDLHISILTGFGFIFVELHHILDLHMLNLRVILELHLSTFIHFGLTFVEFTHFVLTVVELDSFWITFVELGLFWSYSCRY